MRALYTAATGMKAQQLKVDSVANNIANVNTTGFKKTDAQFEDLYYEKVRSGTGATRQGTTAANTVEVGHGARASQVRRDFRQGALQATSNPTDLAIQGDGFFPVIDPQGQELFTRTGNFSLDAQGQLVLPNGMAMAGGLQINGEFDYISVDSEGTVKTHLGETETPVGQIQLRTFVNPAGLSALGGGLYQATEASGVAQVAIAGMEGVGTIQNGMLEMSNVDIAEELIAMIQAQRAYELTGKVIETGDQMMQTTNQLK